MRKVWLIVFCAAASLFACQPSAPKTEFKAVANTQDVMESLVAHMAQNIWDAVKIEIDEKGTHETKPQNIITDKAMTAKDLYGELTPELFRGPDRRA